MRRRPSSIHPTASFSATGRRARAIAQSGYGLRFTDYPPRSANGGNCYACHQMTRQEVSYGTLGPSLLAYGKNPQFRRGRHQGGLRQDLQFARGVSLLQHAAVRHQQDPHHRTDQGPGGVADEPGQPGQQMRAPTPATRQIGTRHRPDDRRRTPMRKSRREIIGAMAASGAVLASTAGARADPAAHRPRPDPEGDRYRLPLSLRLRRPAAFLANAAEHAEPLLGLRVRQLQAQAGRGRARGGHQVLPRRPDRHAVGEGRISIRSSTSDLSG